MKWREKESERSECCLVIRQIGHETWFKRKLLTIRQEEVVADVRKVFHRKRIWRSFLDGKANEGCQ
ncbi:MAG: hypothetical protein H8D23_33925 [Candidatus Brocadiales bacterium]|nr:hypothetical protein [Candidatus Brocadiales bacterium]